MTNLSRRVKKAKELVFSHSPYRPRNWGTWGSGDGEKYYRITLSHQRETVNTPDGKKTISVFVADCQKDTGNGQPCNCQGNCRHTVCYHGLGAIYRSFERAGVKRLVSFFETYESASQMSFGGKVAKVKSANGPGVVWCVVKDWPEARDNEDFIGAQKYSAKEQGILDAKSNVFLMRGNEDDEGID
jgi:hypothetical protein